MSQDTQFRHMVIFGELLTHYDNDPSHNMV